MHEDIPLSKIPENIVEELYPAGEIAEEELALGQLAYEVHDLLRVLKGLSTDQKKRYIATVSPQEFKRLHVLPEDASKDARVDIKATTEPYFSLTINLPAPKLKTGERKRDKKKGLSLQITLRETEFIAADTGDSEDDQFLPTQYLSISLKGGYMDEPNGTLTLQRRAQEGEYEVIWNDRNWEIDTTSGTEEHRMSYEALELADDILSAYKNTLTIYEPLPNITWE